MKTRTKILIGLGGALLLAAASGWLTQRRQPESALEDYKKFLRSQGEKLTLADLGTFKTPAESNSVAAIQSAFGWLSSGNINIPKGMQMIASGQALIGHIQPLACGDEFTNTWESYSEQMMAWQPAIDLLEQVLAKPKLDFELDYSQGIKLLLPHLAPMKNAARILESATIANLHAGNTEQAKTNILTLLAIVQRNKAEGILISHLVRLAMTQIAVLPTWEFIQATNVTDTQLADLQQAWAQFDFIADAVDTFEGERIFGVNIIEAARESAESYRELFGLVSSMSSSGGSSGSIWTWPPDFEAMTERPRFAIGEYMWRSSWSYSDELRLLKCDQILLESVREMRTNQTQYYKADFNRMMTNIAMLDQPDSIKLLFRKMNIPAAVDPVGSLDFSRSVEKSLKAETARRIVITAIALKRHQLQHGAHPAALAELVPVFLPSVPIDPYSGKTLLYRLEPDGRYVLYSVGSNGVDDHGDPARPAGAGSAAISWQDAKANDWVWPQPASSEEIKAYDDAQAAAHEAILSMGIDPATGLPVAPAPARTN